MLDGEPALPPWKRLLDLTCCVLTLPFIGLAGLLVAAWVSLSSPGPWLYTQERVGLKGRRFRLYKFRTMRVDADAAPHRDHFAALLRGNRPMTKLDSDRDPRLIRGGWLLRASGLDELPQILNVLRGEMSLVGPRPCIPYEYDHYSPWHRRRLDALPGLTGLWQVSGKNRTTFDEMVRLDVAYSQTKSFRLDLYIIAKTVPALWTQITQTRDVRGARNSLPLGSGRKTSAPTFPV
jgi:exopolysaccharide production protein ExoY